MNQPKPRHTSKRPHAPSGQHSAYEASSLPSRPSGSPTSFLQPKTSAIRHYLVHESSLLDLVAISIYQHLIEFYGAELDQEMTSDTILTTLKNWACEQCDRHHLWRQTAESMSSTLISQALREMQRDLGAPMLESLDWGEFNQILYQYLYEYPNIGLKERLRPLEESYALTLAQRIVHEMDLGNQSIAQLKRRLDLTPSTDIPSSSLIGSPIISSGPIPEIMSELPTLVQEGEPEDLSFSDQFQADLWSSNARAIAYLRYQAKQNRHQYLEHYITNPHDINALPWELVEQIRLKFGLSAAKLHLLLSAYATQYPQWDQPFTLTAANLIEALGWQTSRPSGPGIPDHEAGLKIKATNLLYALSCVLVKLVWLDHQEPTAPIHSQPITSQNTVGQTPVSKLWDLLMTPQGFFDRQTGEMDTTRTTLLTVRPGLWANLLSLDYDTPAFNLSCPLSNTAKHCLHNFGSIALRLLQLEAYSHDLTMRLVIYLMLDMQYRQSNGPSPSYKVQMLLEQIAPETVTSALTDIKQGQQLFEEWNTALYVLAQLMDSSNDYPSSAHPCDPMRVYDPPYPKWLSPQSSIRKPRGWVKTWLSQTIHMQAPDA